ncbi:MAG: PadR family transcriptional regulator [Nanoarchaeota archaeon]|nr:PadR family transcriptional regulator [Nanoarchaeota archaeon]
MKGTISYNLNGKILFDNFKFGDSFLLFYQEDTKTIQSCYDKFIQQFPQDNSIIFHVCRKNNCFAPDSRIKEFSFNLLDESILHQIQKELNKCYKEVEEKSKSLLLILDWGSWMKEYDNIPKEIFLAFLRNILKKGRGVSPPGWKRKYKTIQKKYPLLIINSFIPDRLDTDFVNELVSSHKRIYLFQKNDSLLSFPGISPYQETIFPQKHTLPPEILEKLVKDNLEILCLVFLEKDSQSGYNILKNIANHFHCILSQGTLYPVLYSLEELGKIIASNGKGREKIYTLSQKGEEELKNKKQQLLQGFQHLASFF